MNIELGAKYKTKFEKCLSIYEKYKLPVDSIKNNISDITDFRVNTPIIGGFSTGKSSMINATLQENLLKTEITAETAVPTEIYYGNNKVFLHNNNQIEEISLDEFSKRELRADLTKVAKIEYNHPLLKEIKNVSLVDMPGFDSGIELHNKAIDNYLPNSLAYIITFSADECVIKQSIVDFLKELKLHEVPVYIVITKCDKVTKEQLEECKAFIQKNIEKLLGIKDIKIACVKSKRDRNTNELKEILTEIQGMSEQIFEKNYLSKLKNTVALAEKYIISRLKNNELSSSELENKERQIEKK